MLVTFVPLQNLFKKGIIMSINLSSLRAQLEKEVNVYAVARDEYMLEVDEKVNPVEDVIDLIIGEEYRLAFL